MAWLAIQGKPWRDQIRFATLDLSGPYRRVFTLMTPDAVQVADPLYRCRRLLTKASERLDQRGQEKLMGLLRAGDPNGDVAAVWQAKEAVRELYTDPDLALEWVTELARDLQDKDYPVEARSLGRTLTLWRRQIAAWHQAHVSNGLTEAVILWRARSGVFDVADRASFSRRRHILWSASLISGEPTWPATRCRPANGLTPGADSGPG
jgi:transposase